MSSDDELYEQVVTRGRRMRRRRKAAVTGALVGTAVVGIGLALDLGHGTDQAVVVDGGGSACRNSRDPACGPFHWDPEPRNEPVAFALRLSPTHPSVGETVTLTVEAHDPEAAFVVLERGHGAYCTPNWGDDGVYPPGCHRSADLRSEDPPRKGPWDPPPPVGASAVATFEHTYTTPGEYTITVYAALLTSDAVRNTDYDVYGGQASDTLTVNVGSGS